METEDNIILIVIKHKLEVWMCAWNCLLVVVIINSQVLEFIETE